MKQIILRPDYATEAEAGGLCLARLALTWAAYGYAVALLWRALPHDPLASAAAWAVALLVGLALAVWTKGV
ncbi:MAG TPA: hypothetical protein VIW73_05705 [Candidatus Cybelea sp.]